jgi:hypothetical protein
MALRGFRVDADQVDLTQAELAPPVGKPQSVASTYEDGKRISSSLC